MKRIFAIALALCMVLCAVGCSNQDETTTVPQGTDNTAVNEGELQLGAYAGSATYTSGDFSMNWVFTLSFLEDGTYILVNDAGEEKSTGICNLTDSCYTLASSDGKTCTFVVQADGSLNILGDLPYGQATIEPAMVGGIVLNYAGEEPVLAGSSDDDATGVTGDYTIAAGTYAASYTKESQMAGTVVYNYTAVIGEDGTFSYSVSFEMAGTAYDGSAAEGTYTLENGVFVFTDSEGNVTEGCLTADDTLVIELMASQMASAPYEVTFTPAQ